jgi:hypothetical protein
MRSSAESALRQVAIAFVVVGAFDLVVGLLSACARISSVARDADHAPADAAEAAGMITFYLASLLSFPVGALVITAGVMLLQRRGRSVGMAAAIAVLLPISCCFLVGIPVGVWTLVVLRRDDVKALLTGTPPPHPPAGYPPPGPW